MACSDAPSMNASVSMPRSLKASLVAMSATSTRKKTWMPLRTQGDAFFGLILTVPFAIVPPRFCSQDILILGQLGFKGPQMIFAGLHELSEQRLDRGVFRFGYFRACKKGLVHGDV